MKDTFENTQRSETPAEGESSTTPWDILTDKNNDNPFDLGDPEPAKPFSDEELAENNPFNIDGAEPSRPSAEKPAQDDPFSLDDSESVPPATTFTDEELAKDNPFDVDAAASPEMPDSGNPFEV